MVRRASHSTDRTPDLDRTDNTKGPGPLDPNDKTKGGQPDSPQGRAADTLMDGSMLMMPGGQGMPGMPGSTPTPDYSLNGPEDPEEEEEE